MTHEVSDSVGILRTSGSFGHRRRDRRDVGYRTIGLDLEVTAQMEESSMGWILSMAIPVFPKKVL